MGKGKVKDQGLIKDFEPVVYLGQNAYRSKKDASLVILPVKVEGGRLFGYSAKEKSDPLGFLGDIGSALKAVPDLRDPRTLGRSVVSLFQGPGREEEELVEEAPLSAELLSLDPDDPKTLARLITDQSLATLSAKFAENPEALNEEGAFDLWMNLTQLEQGFATDPELAAAAMSSLSLGYQEMFASGELDDPDKAEAAAQMFATQFQALKGFGEAALEETVSPEDELTALYEQQVKEQAEFEQMGFYRAGIMDIVSLAPPEARLGLMAGMLQNPEIGKMFFPKPPEPARREPWSPETPTGGLPSESKFELR